MAEDNIKNFIKMLSGKKDDSQSKRKIEAIRNYFRKEEEEFNQKYEKLDYRSYNKLLKKLQENNLVSTDEEKITEISVKKYFIKKSIKKYLILLTSFISILSPILLVNQNITRDETMKPEFNSSFAYSLNTAKGPQAYDYQRDYDEIFIKELIIDLNIKKINYQINKYEKRMELQIIDLRNDIDHIILKNKLNINPNYTGDVNILFN